MDFVRAFGAYVAFDYMNRANNYYEMEERLKGHIRRWEDSLERLAGARSRARSNLEQNVDRLRKAEDFRARLTSSASIDWQDRQRSISDNHHSEERRAEASSKLAEHEAKLVSVEERITRLGSWIDDGERSIREIGDKISSVEDKISSARSKLR